MIYNFSPGMYWGGGGIEYAQAYRAKVLRNIGQNAKFVYTDMFPWDNIQHMTVNKGFLDSEVIWLYTFFTDCKIAPVSYTLGQLENTFSDKNFIFSRTGATVKYIFPENNSIYIKSYMVDSTSDRVHRVEFVSNGCLIRKDYYTYCRIYSEYYAPYDSEACLYHRRFFNENGTVAYEESIDNNSSIYRFPERTLYSKEELIGYMLFRLNLTEHDFVIIDSLEGIDHAVIQNASQAKVGVIIHSDHIVGNDMYAERIPWLNYYMYVFMQHKHISFYITSTNEQNRLLREQFHRYMGVEPKIVTIPAGSLKEIKRPSKARRRYSMITVSRLVNAKHVNWVIEAVTIAKEYVPDLSLDIYGKGPEEENLRKQIKKLQCDNYIHLCGHCDVTELYQNYEAYVSGSISESFGLTLMEAIGSGLPIIGFDVRYGNQNFIDDVKNGYKIALNNKAEKKCIEKMAECIVRLFKEDNFAEFCQHSYKKAEEYLTEKVERRWIDMLKQM